MKSSLFYIALDEEMRALLVTLAYLVIVQCVNGYRGPYRKLMSTREPTKLTIDDDPGEPLFLTPYLEKGQAKEARRLR